MEVFDLARPDADVIRAAARHTGTFQIRHPRLTVERCRQSLLDAQTFFELSCAEKQRLAIANSPHFRGYSEMRNERDWREQVHFGREETANPEFPLLGPNLWPDDLEWRLRVIEWMDLLELVGRDLLKILVPRGIEAEERPYLLLKMILYDVPPEGQPRSGVAPHVDFSWITLTLQDAAGGLEARAPAGDWFPVPPVEGALVVNLGEIVEFETQGWFASTPHRVVNRGNLPRVSLPFFLNPSLSRLVEPVRADRIERASEAEHVHRVFTRLPLEPFVFGEAEWRRKGLGVWCGECVGG